LRQELKDRGIEPVIPGRSNRKRRIRLDKQAYRLRHRIENGICRLKDFRRIATRYDKLARNFLASIFLVAAIVWWIL
jgi:transposase